MVSKHYKTKRYKREKFIRKYLHGDGKVIDSFIVDNGHPMGEEIHEIRSNGLIIIFNKNTGKLITKFIARRRQIEKYYMGSNKRPPKWLLDLAKVHESMGLNYL